MGSIFASTAALLSALLIAAPVSGKPTSPTGTSPPPPSPAPAGAAPAPAPASESDKLKDNAPEFAQALEAAFLGNDVDAARLAYVAMSKIKKGADKYEGAELALSGALEKLGLEQAAAEHYMAIARERHNTALFARVLRQLDALARTGALSEDELVRGVLGDVDLASIPPDVADFLHYYRGLSNLKLGFRSWAESDFSAITPDGYYGRLAAFVSAIVLVKEGDVDQALEAIQKLAEPDAERVPPPAVKKGMDAEVHLARARLLYEQGKTPEAIEAYRKLRLPRTTAGDALLERAWAHYRSGAYHDAMGLLYALGAPAFRDLYLPDQYILRGLIYQRFCHFRAAKAAVADFRSRYGATLGALMEGTKPEALPVVLSAVLETDEVRPAKETVDAAEREEKRLADLHGKLEAGGLAQHLDRLYAVLQNRAGLTYRQSLDREARRSAERLLEANEQANLLEYEVGVSIFRPVKAVAGVARSTAEKVPSSGPRVFFPFDQEYWSDELPDMRFLIQDRCVE